MLFCPPPLPVRMDTGWIARNEALILPAVQATGAARVVRVVLLTVDNVSIISVSQLL